MSKVIQLDIITPIKTFNYNDVKYLRAPSIEGLFGILPGHIPSIIALDIGEIKVIHDKKTLRISTSGGFADIKKDKVLLVLETAELATEIDIKRAENSLAKSSEKLIEKSSDIKKARDSIRRAKNRISIFKKSS